jgi:class 3 adenylate cyclase
LVKRILVRRIAKRPGAAVAQHPGGGKKTLGNETITRFNPSILNLGDISTPCQEKEAVAAVLDLTGFTAFCSQVDSYLAIPRFLNDFLEWFFYSIRDGLTEENFGNRSSFWADFPLLVKFLGDGILLVWGARRMTEDQICRIVTTLFEICRNYRREFYPRISMAVNKPPAVLRCGVARGKVFTVGEGRDFVGHCINTASRLSHLEPLTFSFPHRGFQVRDNMPPEYLRLFIPKYISIRGVGDNELVWVVKEEYDRLAERKKGFFRNLERITP